MAAGGTISTVNVDEVKLDDHGALPDAVQPWLHSQHAVQPGLVQESESPAVDAKQVQLHDGETATGVAQQDDAGKPSTALPAGGQTAAQTKPIVSLRPEADQIVMVSNPNQAERSPKITEKSTSNTIMGPPESLEPATIYKLYRGSTGEIDGENHRVWVEFPALQLCWASYDQPAHMYNRFSLLDVARVDCDMSRVEIHVANEVASVESRLSQRASLSIGGCTGPLLEFGKALQQLLHSRDSEGRSGLEFIQKRLFQYLWFHQSSTQTEETLYEAQAVLAFNLEPKKGIEYVQSRLNKRTDEELGEWLAQMAAHKGGLDPTLLGNYFSRVDTLQVFRAFVRCLDFKESDIVVALRRLFDTFKPGGEGQVITRILEYFAEAYFLQWQSFQDTVEPKVAYGNSDSVFQVAVSLIMLNTGLHVAPKKVGKRAPGVAMTVEQYIENTRQLVSAEEAPEQAMRRWYDAVKELEISVEPLPRVAFSQLPVQPDIEGWLIAVLSAHVQHRYWAVLALQRMYLFADASEVEPGDAIDLKDVIVHCVVEDDAAKERFSNDLLRKNRGHLCQCFTARELEVGSLDFQDAEARAFEVCQKADKPTILQKLAKEKPRTRLALVAESPDLMEKWVSLISSGPY